MESARVDSLFIERERERERKRERERERERETVIRVSSRGSETQRIRSSSLEISGTVTREDSHMARRASRIRSEPSAERRGIPGFFFPGVIFSTLLPRGKKYYIAPR